MNLTVLALRFRWLQLPAGLLVLLLQRTPALRVAVQFESMFSDSAPAVLRSAFAVLAMGAYNSLAGATTFNVTATPVAATPKSGLANAKFAVPATSGTAMSVVVTVSGAPGNPKSWSVTGALPDGLSVNGGNPVNVTAPYKMTITGTPTATGSFPVFVTAWANANAAGDNGRITLTFTVSGGVANVAPAITTQPANQAVTAGGAASFTVAASGTPAPAFQWQKNGAAITGATSATYMIASSVASDAGNYTAVATNSAGTATSSVATLTVNPAAIAPAITTQPVNVTVTAGGPASFTVAASGTPAPTFQWKKDGVNIAGASSTTYTIASTVAGDAGSYTVVATNSGGNATSAAATLTVNAVATLPAFTLAPVGATVTVGKATTFSAVANGSPAPALQWQGSADGGTSWSNLSNDSTYSGVATGTLALSNTLATMTDIQYRCVATNSAGSASSSAATLVILTACANFNHDATADILWHNTATGLVCSWLTGSGFQVFGTEGGGWQIIGTGDFDGDGKADVLWHDTATGLVASWTSGGGFMTFGNEGGGWLVLGTGDLDGDGKVDVLWHNTSTGLVAAWTSTVGFTTYGTEGGGWQVVGTGDFDGDGKADLIWRNSTTGVVSAVFTAGGGLGLGTEGGGMQIVGVGDFNGDGKADVLWHNTATGAVTSAYTSGGGSNLGTEGAGWQVIGTGDFDGDGKTDVLWRNTATGLVASWTSGGGFTVFGVEGDGWGVVD